MSFHLLPPPHTPALKVAGVCESPSQLSGGSKSGFTHQSLQFSAGPHRKTNMHSFALTHRHLGRIQSIQLAVDCERKFKYQKDTDTRRTCETVTLLLWGKIN